MPEFGDWSDLIALDQDLASAPIRQAADPQGPSASGMPPRDLPWRPPMPLQPWHPERWFRPGTRYALPSGDRVIVEVKEAGTLRTPSGRLAAMDPVVPELDAEPFTVAVPPEEYPMRLSVIRFKDAPLHLRVAATHVVIRDEPAVTWEMALCDGQDPRLVRDGAFFGFGVDAGVGCFYDHAAGGDIVTVTEDDWETFTEVERDQTLELTASGSDANLITFSSGWGDGAYPTWIGRNVTGFVADMLVLHETEQLAEQR